MSVRTNFRKINSTDIKKNVFIENVARENKFNENKLTHDKRNNNNLFGLDIKCHIKEKKCHVNEFTFLLLQGITLFISNKR